MLLVSLPIYLEIHFLSVFTESTLIISLVVCTDCFPSDPPQVGAERRECGEHADGKDKQQQRFSCDFVSKFLLRDKKKKN